MIPAECREFTLKATSVKGNQPVAGLMGRSIGETSQFHSLIPTSCFAPPASLGSAEWSLAGRAPSAARSHRMLPFQFFAFS